MQIEPEAYEILTFDCYGTLVDWETGLGDALEALFQPIAGPVDRSDLLARFARHESGAEEGEYRSYRDVLATVVDGIAGEFDARVDSAQRGMLADSLPDWPVFPDTVAALQRLAGRYRLGILSNIDDDLFAGTSKHLGVEFEPVVTAQQVGSYKPALRNFETLLERVNAPEGRLLHVAQSLFHDLAPVMQLGISCLWVDRRGGEQGGATPASAVTPENRVRSLAEVADLLGC
ncbi:MAG: HAD-IA family hydrolase [Acidobacteria bacterium]|nr:HAD-IA family hydrolase [Acidobacteriota bacterium]